MAKKLTTTVHITGEDGETRVLGPNSKLTAADRKELESRWGKRAAEFYEDDGDPDPEELSQEKLSGERPLADTGPADRGTQVKEAAKVRQAANDK